MDGITIGLLLGSLIASGFLIKAHLDSTKELQELKDSVKNIHSRIDQIFTVDTPSKNEAVEQKDNGILLSEDNPLSLPKDVKFEIEGGDTQTPPGYKEN